MCNRVLVVWLLAVLFFFLALVLPDQSCAQARQEIVPVITYSLQPSGSDSLRWSFGSYATKGRDNTAKIARGIDVKPTSTGGNLKVHMLNDYDSRGRETWLVYPIPASNGQTQRIGLIFDKVDSAGTTISKTDIIVWY